MQAGLNASLGVATLNPLLLTVFMEQAQGVQV